MSWSQNSSHLTGVGRELKNKMMGELEEKHKNTWQLGKKQGCVS